MSSTESKVRDTSIHLKVLILIINISRRAVEAKTFVVSHIQRIGCQPEKLLNTVANPARGLLNREKKRTKE